MINTETMWTRTGWTIVLGVTDAPATVKQYFEYTIQPDQVRLEYSRNDDSDWSEGYATVSGPRLKKDGTPGKSTGNVSFYTLAAAPEWLRELVEYHRPSGAI